MAARAEGAFIRELVARVPSQQLDMSNAAVGLDKWREAPMVGSGAAAALYQLSSVRISAVAQALSEAATALLVTGKDRDAAKLLEVLERCLVHYYYTTLGAGRAKQSSASDANRTSSAEDAAQDSTEKHKDKEECFLYEALENLISREKTCPASADFSYVYQHVVHSDAGSSNLLDSNLALTLARPLFNMFALGAVEKSTFADPERLVRAAGAVLFQLSITKFDVVYSLIRDSWDNCAKGQGSKNPFYKGTLPSNDEVKWSPMRVVEFLYLNQNRLWRVLELTQSFTSHLKKGAIMVIAGPLRKAVWNYMHLYPGDLPQLYEAARGRDVKKCAQGPSPSADGQPSHELFHLSRTWPDSMKKRAVVFPLSIMLFVLNPDRHLHADIGGCSDEKNPTFQYCKLIRKLKKLLKNKSTQDIGLRCLSDLLKLATFLHVDNNPLYNLVSDVDTQIKELLFHRTKEAKGILFSLGGEHSVERQDVVVMIDFLVGQFIMRPPLVMRQLFLQCLLPTAPASLKLILIRALLALAEGRYGVSLEEDRELKDAYWYLASPLRMLFQSYVFSNRKIGEKKDKLDKKSKPVDKDIAQAQNETIVALIGLYRLEPALALANGGHSSAAPQSLTGEEDPVSQLQTLFTSLCMCVWDVSCPDIPPLAAETLLSLHEPSMIPQWFPEDPCKGFHQIHSAIDVCFGKVLLSTDTMSADQVMALLDVLLYLIRQSTSYIASLRREGIQDTVDISQLRSHCLEQIESGLLVQLCSWEPELVKRAVMCFGALCDQVDVLGEHDSDWNPIAANYPLYRQLATQGVKVFGRVAQQKTIRNILRAVERETPGNMAAWEEVYKRWQHYTRTYVAPDNKKGSASQDVSGEADNARLVWQNYTGFLCALGGVCLSRSNETEERPPQSGNKGRRSAQTMLNITALIKDMLELLISEDLFVRQSVISSFGSSLCPAIYSTLFSHIQAKVASTLGDASGTVTINEKSSLFVEVAISVVKLILEQPQDSSDNLALANFENLIHTFTRYISLMTKGDDSDRLKCRLCILTDVMMSRKKFISFQDETHFRKTMLHYALEWTSEAALRGSPDKKEGEEAKEEPPPPPPPATSQGKSKKAGEQKPMDWPTDRESARRAWLGDNDDTEEERNLLLDENCMRAVGALLKDFPLQNTGFRRNSEEDKSRMFLKLFTYLQSVLKSCWKINQTTIDDEMKLIHDNTIKALSNLLNANIDAGLEYFIEMGYDEDDELRRSFLTVLTTLISERTNEDFDEEEDKDGDSADDGTANLSGQSQRLIQLLLEPDMMLVTALVSVVNISDADNLATHLVKVFLEFGDVQVLLKTAITREVKSTLSAETLFRSNSVASKMMGAYSKIIAADYLKQTLRQSVLEVCGNYAGHEVDPARLAPGEDVQANVARLISTATMFLNAIFQSAPTCPEPVREVCRYLHNSVNDAFEGCGNKSIGGFLFLRYFCPAVVAPDGYGILEQRPSEGARRVLVLVAKMLQNLANGILFGAKEASMPVELNPFISENLTPVENYYACLLAVGQDVAPSPTPRHTAAGERESHKNLISENNMETINRIITSNMNKVRAFVAEKCAATDVRSESGNVIERLEGAMVGAESARGGDSASDQSNILFETFMKQNEKNNIDAMVDLGVFFQGPGLSASGNPVFYYIARRLTPDINKELFLYYILRTLRGNFAKGKSYDLVFDSTLFEEENMLEYSWCMKLWKMVPRVLKSNLSNIYVLHANSTLKRVSKKIAPFVNWKSMKKFHFVSKPSELADYIPDCQEVLPKDAVKTETEIHSSFPGVTLNSRHEVALHLSPNLLHVVTHRDYMFGIMATMTDFIPISSIQEVTNNDRGRKCDPGEFILRFIVNGVERSINFSSGLCEPIMAAIRASVVRESQASQLDQMQKATGGRTFRASEVPGTLLNMALLNLGSVSPHTREAANDLLCQLSATFNFSVSLPLMTANGKVIPSNTLPFVNNVSRLIAENEPQFTLEILREWRHAFPKVSPQLQHTCIEYVTPWLQQLRVMCESTDKNEKGKEVLQSLIDMTIGEKRAFNSLLTGLWRHIGQHEPLSSFAFDYLVEYAVRDLSNVEETRLVHEIIVQLASQNPVLISQRIITRVLDILDDASITFAAMEGPGLWGQLSVLIHCLAELSFSDLYLVETYMGEMIHLILMTFNTGLASMKNSVYSLTINLLQALCEHNICNEEGWKLESQLTQPKFKLIFLGSGAGMSSSAPPPASGKSTAGPATTKRPGDRGGENTIAVEKVASALMTTICGCENREKWHSTWVKLTRRTALSGPACLRPRAFVTLGVAFRQPLTDELLHDILNGLHAVLPISLSASDFAVPMSILTCLRHLFANWPRRPEVCGDMFWFAVSLLHVGDEHLFPSTLAMLGSVIKTTNAILSSQRKSGHTKVGLGAYLMSCRDRRPELEQACQRLESVAGLNFRSSFAFAMVSSVLKGLCFPPTRRDTIDLLSLLIDIANTEASDTENWFVSQCEGITYTLALMPLYMTTNLVATLPVVQPVQVWVRDRSIGPSIFSHPLFQSNESVSMLLGSIYIAMAKHIDTDVQVTTYRTLADAIVSLPGQFQTIYPSLFELLYSVLLKDQTNENVQEAALSLIQVTVSDGGVASSDDQLSETLQMMGFKSILSMGQMKVLKDEDQTKTANLVKVSCDLMQTVVSLNV